MKKLTIFIFTMIFLTGCSTGDIKKVDVYEMESFSVIETDSLTSFTDSNDVSLFIHAFENADKEAGIVDIADPEYKVQIGEESYFLWIREDQGTIMNVNDTHTIYSLTESSSNKISELLN